MRWRSCDCAVDLDGNGCSLWSRRVRQSQYVVKPYQSNKAQMTMSLSCFSTQPQPPHRTCWDTLQPPRHHLHHSRSQNLDPTRDPAPSAARRLISERHTAASDLTATEPLVSSTCHVAPRVQSSPAPHVMNSNHSAFARRMSRVPAPLELHIDAPTILPPMPLRVYRVWAPQHMAGATPCGSEQSINSRHVSAGSGLTAVASGSATSRAPLFTERP